MEEVKIVVVGGGTGTYTVLKGLKRYTSNITAVVSMADSGGSAKKERDEFGLLPVSDVRKSLIALAGEDDKGSNLIRGLLGFRFYEGVGISGMTFGNLFLVALSRILGSQVRAIEEAGKILKVKGRVLPVTEGRTNLVAEYEDSSTVVGEDEIDNPKHDGKLRIKRLYLLPEVEAYSESLQEILKADLLVFGPGDLYTTLLANFVVKGVVEAVRRSRAKKVYIVNLMTKCGQTYGFSALDHVREVLRYLECSRLDAVIMNTTPLPQEILSRYKEENDFPVVDDLPASRWVVRGDFLARKRTRRQKGDTLKRSLIRHDSEKLARAIISL